jgi:hypothetical protein
MAQTDGLNDHLFGGTFSNPNPLTARMGEARFVARLGISVKVETTSGMARARLARGRSGEDSLYP